MRTSHKYQKGTVVLEIEDDVVEQKVAEALELTTRQKLIIGFKEVGSTVLVGPAITYFANSFGPGITVLGDAIKWASQQTGGASYAFLAGASGRLFSPYDPTNSLTPPKDAGFCKMLQGYSLKYGIKLACQTVSAYAVNALDHFLEPYYSSESQKLLFVAGTTKVLAQTLELGTLKLGECIASSTRARVEMARREGGVFAASASSDAERRQPLMKGEGRSEDTEMSASGKRVANRTPVRGRL